MTLDIAWTADEAYNAEEAADYTFSYVLSVQEGEELEFVLSEEKAEGTVTVTVEANELAVVDLLAETDNKTKETTVTATVKYADEEATATVAIFAYDEEGELVEDAVVPAFEVEIDEEGNIKEEIDVKELESGNYKVVVTVTQVVEEEEVTAKDEFNFELDFKAVDAAVEAVNKADTQIKLWNALKVINENFEGVAIQENILAYADQTDGLGTDYDTIAEINAAVKDINKAEAAKGEFATVKAALEAAKGNQLTIIGILNDNFEDVDPDNIVAYQNAIFGNDDKVKDEFNSIKDIQNAIYEVNATAAVDALFEDDSYDALAEGVDQAKIDAAKTMVEALKEKEVNVADLETKLATAQGLLDAADALEAATEAVNALFVDADAEEKELALGVDQDAIDAAKDLVKEVTEEEKTKLNGLIEEAEKLLAEFAIELSGQFATMGADTSLGNVRGYTVGFALKGEYKMKDLTNVVMNVYKDKDLLASVTATDKFFSTEEGGLGETNNQSAPFDVFGDFDYVEDGYWNYSGWQGELLDFPTKVEILVTYENGRTAKLTSTTLIEDKWGSTVLLFDAFFVENVNRAETVDEMNAALLALVENGNNDYLNVPGADRLFVANEILEARNEATDKEFENYDALTTALTNALETRTEALDGVNNTLNADSKISDVIDVLEAVSAEFAEMTNAEKADIAEAFFLGLEFVEEAQDGEPTLKTPFRTLAAVKAAAGL